jgi:hypothetical protein
MKMSQRRIAQFAAVAVIVAMLLPVLAVPAGAKDLKATLKAQISVVNAVTLGGKQLKAGSYVFVAAESKVPVLSDGGKVVLEAPVQWQDAKQKYDSSALVIEGSVVKEIRFSGKSRTAIVQE